MKGTMVALLATLAAGCGAMFHGATQSIPVNSTPPGALLLRRNAEGCAITVSKTGYESQTVALARGKSASMVANVPTSIASALGGGILGLLVPGYVDAKTGAMYTQRPERVDVTLRPVK